MDGEWFIEWSPTVESGSEATLTYSLSGDDEEPSFDLDVDSIETEKVTLNTQASQSA